MLEMPRPPMRRIVAVCTALLALALVAATPAQFGPLPVLAVYPFQVGKGLEPAAGVDFATKIANAIEQTGGVTVAPSSGTVAPADFLTAAHAAGADYYLTGFISPIGHTVTVIQQLVSVRSGTVVWSNSAEVITQGDADAQAALIHNVLQQYSTRGYAALGFTHAGPTPAAVKHAPKGIVVANAPAPANLPSDAPPLKLPNEAYGFSSKPTPKPKIYASAANASSYAVLPITSKQPSTVREYAANALIYALGKRGKTAALADPDSESHPLLRGSAICADTGAHYLVWGSIATVSSDASTGADMWTNATMSLEAWDCKGGGFVRNTKAQLGSAFSWRTAIDHAAESAVNDYLLRLPGATTAS